MQLESEARNKEIASWPEYTFKKLKQVYIRIPFERVIVVNLNSDMEINWGIRKDIIIN